MFAHIGSIVFVVIFILGAVQSVRIPTPNSAGYIMLRDYGIHIKERSSLVFSVKAPQDAEIGLFKYPETEECAICSATAYEIRLGGHGNSKSDIRPYSGAPYEWFDTPNILDPDTHRVFWVSWSMAGNSRIIAFGKGTTVNYNIVGQQTFSGEDVHDVNYIFVALRFAQGGDCEFIFPNDYGDEGNYRALIDGPLHNIPDASLTASSFLADYRPHGSRIETCAVAGCGWATEELIPGDWIQADLGETFFIAQVATQSVLDELKFVTFYKIEYSQDGSTFIPADDGRFFKGNDGINSIVTNEFFKPFKARYVKLIIGGFEGHPALRWEVFGNSLPRWDTTVEVTTDPELEDFHFSFTPLHPFGISLKDHWSVIFQVKTDQQAYLAMSTFPRDWSLQTYVFALGTESNSVCEIKLEVDTEGEEWADCPSVLDASEFRTFWVDCSRIADSGDRLLRLGQGSVVNQNILVETTRCSEFFGLNYVAVGSAHGAVPAVWRFTKDFEDTLIPDDTLLIHTDGIFMDDSLNYLSLQPYGVTLEDRSSITFSVRSEENVIVALSEESDPYGLTWIEKTFHVFIGIDVDFCAISHDTEEFDFDTMVECSPLDGEHYKHFFISWSDFEDQIKINLGYGAIVGFEVILSRTFPKEFDIRHIAITAPMTEHGADWAFEKDVCEFCVGAAPLISGPVYSIPDAQLSASSSASEEQGAAASRLTTCFDPFCMWYAGSYDVGEYLQADLGTIWYISKVATLGGEDSIFTQDDDTSDVSGNWVSKYQVSYSKHEMGFQLADGGKVFTGNSDAITVVTNTFETEFQARYVRLILTEFTAPATVWELYGCKLPSKVDELQRSLIDGHEYSVRNSALSASSYYQDFSQSHASSASRFMTCYTFVCAWDGSIDDQRWIQVDLGGLFRLTKIGTMGRYSLAFENRITEFSISYKGDADGLSVSRWLPMDNGKIYDGNTDVITPLMTKFKSNAVGQHVRLWVVDFVDSAALRWELFGCKVSSLTCNSCGGQLALLRGALHSVPYSSFTASSSFTSEEIEIHTPLADFPNYVSLEPYGINAIGRRDLVFSVKAKWDVFIALTPRLDDFDMNSDLDAHLTHKVEFAINCQYLSGANSNQLLIRSGTQNSGVVVPFNMNEGVFITLWISWATEGAQRVVKIGQGSLVHQDVANQMSLENTFEIQYISIGRFFKVGGDGYWRFTKERHGPENSILNQCLGGCAWEAGVAEVEEFIQVDLTDVFEVGAITTQGSHAADRWITRYKLQYMIDGLQFSDVEGGMIFTGNYDRDTPVRNELTEPFKAQHVRLIVEGFNERPALRWELYGCRPDNSRAAKLASKYTCPLMLFGCGEKERRGQCIASKFHDHWDWPVEFKCICKKGFTGYICDQFSNGTFIWKYNWVTPRYCPGSIGPRTAPARSPGASNSRR